MFTLIQFDNPNVIVLRDGKNWDYPITTRVVDGKTIHESRFPVCENDVFIAMSDGAIYAGIGMSFNYGWQRDDIIQFAEANYSVRKFGQDNGGHNRRRVQFAVCRTSRATTPRWPSCVCAVDSRSIWS